MVIFYWLILFLSGFIFGTSIAKKPVGDIHITYDEEIKKEMWRFEVDDLDDLRKIKNGKKVIFRVTKDETQK